MEECTISANQTAAKKVFRGQMDEHVRRLETCVGRLRDGGAPSLAELRFGSVPLGRTMSAIERGLRSDWQNKPNGELTRESLRSMSEFVLSQWLAEAFPRLADPSRAAGETLWNWLGQARWAADAFPTIQLTPSVAGSLVATSGTTGDEEAIVMPWRCFVVAAPSDEEELFPGGVRWVMLNATSIPRNSGPRTVQVHLQIDATETQPCVSLWVSHHTPEQIVAHYCGGGATYNDTPFEDTPTETRLRDAAAKLAVGAGLAITSSNARVRRKGKRGKGKRAVVVAQDGSAPGDTYQLGLPIKCDLSRDVAEWIECERETITRRSLRWLVRGHWRAQACGKGLQQRKRTWIAPYWKGPERGTILVRPHKVEDP